ncbi:hypothetical protein RUND412_002041 [Rhizina undulata]
MATEVVPKVEHIPEAVTVESWYAEDVKTLPEGVVKLFTEYAGIPEDEVIPHINKFRVEAWKIYPYPCIGGFRFLKPSLATSPHYPRILSRLQSSQSAKLLDLGCCFGFDLRQAIFDGAPPHTLIGSDLQGEFLELGYDMFLDREKLKDSGIQFIPADIFDDASPLFGLEGTIDVVHAGSFLHLFGWDGQVNAAKRIARLLKPGGILIGRSAANLNPTLIKHKAGEMFLHNSESFEKMWGEVGGEWKIESALEARTDIDLAKTEAKFWDWLPSRADTRRIRFIVEKL